MAIRLQRSAWWAGGLALLLSAIDAPGQGMFQNLDFERATVPATPINGYGNTVDPALAFPGWTVSASASTNPFCQLFALYNNRTLDSPAVDLIGPLFPNATGYSSLQGSYSVGLQYSALFNVFPFLSQTGHVPTDARSISILVPSGSAWWQWPSVNLSGVNIPLTPLGDGRVGGDVSSFAGTTVDLTFSTGTYFAYFDNVVFSNQPIPEPGVVGFFALGVLLVWRFRGRPA
jgi:hypothetical protein